MNKYQKEFSKLVKWDIRFQERFYHYRVKSYSAHRRIIKDSLEVLKERHLIKDDMNNIRNLRSYIQCAFTDKDGKLKVIK